MPLDMDTVDSGAEAVATACGVVFGALDSLWRVRRHMLRWLQIATRSATMAGLVVAMIRSFLSL